MAFGSRGFGRTYFGQTGQLIGATNPGITAGYSSASAAAAGTARAVAESSGRSLATSAARGYSKRSGT